MKTGHSMIVAALGVGAILGAAAAGNLRAQGPPTAYAVIEISEFTDPESFKAVLANTPMGLVPFGGRFVIRSDNVVPLDGVPPKRFVLIAFDTMDRAQRWSASAAVKENNAIRSRAAKWRSFLVEGPLH
jgi:uncharacterized protein (DUF1330 family)